LPAGRPARQWVAHEVAAHVGGDQHAGQCDVVRRRARRAGRRGVRRTTGVSSTDLTEHEHDDGWLWATYRSGCCTPPATHRAASASLWTASWSPATRCSCRAAGVPTFPGGDPDALYTSLQQLAALTGDPVVHPGHQYSPEPKGAAVRGAPVQHGLPGPLTGAVPLDVRLSPARRASRIPPPSRSIPHAGPYPPSPARTARVASAQRVGRLCERDAGCVSGRRGRWAVRPGGGLLRPVRSGGWGVAWSAIQRRASG